MVEVFRVEDERGDGPYRGDDEHEYLYRHNGSARHPNPWRDGCGIEEDEVCCFQSLAHLEEWFNSQDRSFLAEWGYVLAVYDVPEDLVRHGNRQSVFARGDDYEPVRRLELN